jgi:hypothetical protein
LLIGEEMVFAGDRATGNKLKHLITGSTLSIEYKFGDALEIESYHRLLLTSNNDQIFQAAGEERRFVTYDVSNERRGDVEYFDKLYAIADGRDRAGAAAFMQYLLNRDLAGFRPWQAQQSFAADAALVRQKELSLAPPLVWLREVIEALTELGPAASYYWRDGLPASASSQPNTLFQGPLSFLRRELLDGFRSWANKVRPFGASEYTSSAQRFWTEICKVVPRAQTTKQNGKGDRKVLIDLNVLQHNFDKYLRGEVG